MFQEVASVSVQRPQLSHLKLALTAEQLELRGTSSPPSALAPVQRPVSLLVCVNSFALTPNTPNTPHLLFLTAVYSRVFSRRQQQPTHSSNNLPLGSLTVVMNRYRGCLLSVYLTVMGLRSYRNQMAGMILPVWL